MRTPIFQTIVADATDEPLPISAAIVAVGTRFHDKRDEIVPAFRLPPVDENAMSTSAFLDRLGLWGIVAVALTIVAYAGPIHDWLAQHRYLALGLRTW